MPCAGCIPRGLIGSVPPACHSSRARNFSTRRAGRSQPVAHGGLVRYANANAAVEEPDLRDVQCARLDVHELARDGKLTLGKRGTLFGTVGFEVVGGPDAQQLVLEFPIKSASGERLDPVRQIISCYWRQAHYGGRYLMFLCSECGSPARVLYARYFSDRIWFFNCRSCVGITYQSTMGHRWDRSARRVEKLRARLQWSVGTAPIKPRGMHKRTYQRILGTLTYHEAIRKQGAGYARKCRPDQHRAHLWRQCRSRFVGLGGWPVR